jgi:hypothetical protein
MRDWGMPWFLAILLGLVMGALIGAWQGFWVAYVGIPAFIVTLSGMMLFRGMLNQLIGKSNTIPVRRTSRSIGAGYLPEVGPNTGYNNLTVLLGLIICRGDRLGHAAHPRRNQARSAPTPNPLAVMWTRLALICAAILVVALLMASAVRAPRSPSPASSSAPWSSSTASSRQDDHRTARLRRRWQPPRRRAVRREASGQLPRHDEHVDPRRPRRHDVRRPLERLRPLRRRRLGARRDRGRLHRWRGRHRWRRHRGRLHHRWSGHGGPQQRPAAQGHRRRRHPDDQGPRAPHRRRLRRLNKMQGRPSSSVASPGASPFRPSPRRIPPRSARSRPSRTPCSAAPRRTPITRRTASFRRGSASPPEPPGYARVNPTER